MKATTATTRSTMSRRIGALALGLAMIFGVAACGGDSAQSEANDRLIQLGLDPADFEGVDIEAELEALEEFNANLGD